MSTLPLEQNGKGRHNALYLALWRGWPTRLTWPLDDAFASMMAIISSSKYPTWITEHLTCSEKKRFGKKKKKNGWPKRDSNPCVQFGTAWETLNLTIRPSDHLANSREWLLYFWLSTYLLTLDSTTKVKLKLLWGKSFSYFLVYLLGFEFFLVACSGLELDFLPLLFVYFSTLDFFEQLTH